MGSVHFFEKKINYTIAEKNVDTTKSLYKSEQSSELVKEMWRKNEQKVKKNLTKRL